MMMMMPCHQSLPQQRPPRLQCLWLATRHHRLLQQLVQHLLPHRWLYHNWCYLIHLHRSGAPSEFRSHLIASLPHTCEHPKAALLLHMQLFLSQNSQLYHPSRPWSLTLAQIQ